MKIKNPFTPGKTVDPEYFAGREKEINRFLSYLKSARDGNPMNLAVLGERGIGKSSLLRKFATIAKEQKCITIRIDLDNSFESLSTLATVILNEIKKAGQAYTGLFSVSEKIKSFFKDYKITLELLGSSLEMDKKTTSPNTSLAFRSELFKIWANIKDIVPAVIIMIDEAEELEHIEGGVLAILRNVFTRLAEENCGYMVIISGKLTLFNRIKKIHSPLARFFNPITLNELTFDESMDAIIKPLSESSFNLSNDVQKTIIRVSEGHPYIIQLFGYYLCENSIKPAIDENIYNTCFPLILDGLAAQLFDDYYNSLSQREQRILLTIADEPEDIISVGIIAQKENKKNQEITSIIDRLYKKDCLKKITRGQYQLFHGLFKEYLKNKKLFSC